MLAASWTKDGARAAGNLPQNLRVEFPGRFVRREHGFSGCRIVVDHT
jgi:hypothetical protein